MSVTVDAVLDDRRERLNPRHRVPGLIVAAALHVAAIGLAIGAPRALRQTAPPPEYVAVQVVPARALGVERPLAPPLAAKATPTPVAKPEPTPLVPEPAKRAEPKKPSATAKPSPKPSAPAVASSPPPSEPAPSEANRLGSPEGAAAGSAAFGAPVAQLDNPDFTYGYYVDQMLALIAAQWVRPPLGGGVEAMIHFEIAADGQIRDVRIVSSSGYSSFDLAGLRAVQAASPLPPLPRSYRRDTLGVNLIVR